VSYLFSLSTLAFQLQLTGTLLGAAGYEVQKSVSETHLKRAVCFHLQQKKILLHGKKSLFARPISHMQSA
jgi:hypothetical protein